MSEIDTYVSQIATDLYNLGLFKSLSKGVYACIYLTDRSDPIYSILDIF